MNQFKIIVLFIRFFYKNYDTKIAIDEVADEISNLVNYSDIVKLREVSIDLYNVCKIADHIIDILFGDKPPE